jgi:aspartate/methionine/tyrosine aminotransferase
MKKLAKGMDRIQGEAAFEVLARTKELEKNGMNILHFEIGQPDFPTPENVVEAGKQALEEGHTGYVTYDGILELKEAVRDEIKKTRGYRPDIEQVVIVPGGKPTIFFTMLATVDAGDDVIFPDPGYPTYRSVTRYLGAKEKPVPLLEENQFRMTPDQIRERITEKTKLIIINSPENPTGSVITKRELQEIEEMVEERDIFLLSDEIYSKMTYDQAFYSPTTRDEALERTILLDGFSKSYSMTGWRLGWLIAPPALADKIGITLINAISCTTNFVQRAGVEALTGPQNPVHRMMKAFRIRRGAMVKGLNTIPGFSCLKPEGAFYAFPNIKRTGYTSQELADLLLEKAGVAVLPGTAFGPAGEGYLRFSYASSLDDIQMAIERIKTFIE